MDKVQDLGEIIGRAIAGNGGTAFNVKEAQIDIDAEPIADAVKRGSDATAQALVRAMDSSTQNFVRSLAEAIEELPQVPSNEGLEEGLRGVTEAIKRNELMPAVQLIVTALDKQANETAKAAVVGRDIVAALRENTAAIRAEKTITDTDGRTLKMKVGK